MKNYKIKLRTRLRFPTVINKFMLLFRKGVYPYNYMNDWKMFNELALLEKEKFYNNLNMKNLQM